MLWLHVVLFRWSLFDGCTRKPLKACNVLLIHVIQIVTWMDSCLIGNLVTFFSYLWAFNVVYKVRFKSGGLSILTGLSTFKNDAQILKLSTDLGRANIGIKSLSLKETCLFPWFKYCILVYLFDDMTSLYVIFFDVDLCVGVDMMMVKRRKSISASSPTLYESHNL